MGPVGVVVIDVVDDEAFELALVPDDGSVEQLASQGPDPSLGEGVGHGGADRGLEDLEALGSKDLVECIDELAAPIANEGLCAGEPIGVLKEQVAGSLGGPRAGRIGGDAGEEHLAGGDVDEEQHVVAAQQCGVDGQEVAGDCSLGVQELRPGDLRSLWGRVDAVLFEDSPDGGGPYWWPVPASSAAMRR